MSVVSRLEPWPSPQELQCLRAEVVAHAAAHGVEGVVEADVRVVAAPYRVCPLGAHIDHQGGVVAGLALNMGVMVGFLPTPYAPDDVDVELDSMPPTPVTPNDAGDGWTRTTPFTAAAPATAADADAAAATDGGRMAETTVCLRSDTFGGEVGFDLNDIPPPGHVGAEEANWGAYPR